MERTVDFGEEFEAARDQMRRAQDKFTQEIYNINNAMDAASAWARQEEEKINALIVAVSLQLQDHVATKRVLQERLRRLKDENDLARDACSTLRKEIKRQERVKAHYRCLGIRVTNVRTVEPVYTVMQ